MAGEQHPFDLPRDTFVEPGVGEAQAKEAPEGAAAPTLQAESEFVPRTQYQELKTEVERLKPLENLTWIGEAMADPSVRQRVTSALFSGGGAPMVEAPAPDPKAAATSQIDGVRAKYKAAMSAALQAGDMEAYGDAAASMGAEIGRIQSAADLQSVAGPFVTMTANNTIENFYTQKRATSALFGKVETKLRAFVNQTPPSKLAELAQSGQLISALEVAYQKIVADTYEQAYNKANAEGTLGGGKQEPPNYSMGRSGGGMPAPQRESTELDDKDDSEFQKLMESRGVEFAIDPKTGAITGELRR